MYEKLIGTYGSFSQQMSTRRQKIKMENFSISLLSAVTLDRVVATQMIEGGVDATLFENFLYHTIASMRKNKTYSKKDIVILMDNAVIHKHPMILETAR